MSEPTVSRRARGESDRAQSAVPAARNAAERLPQPSDAVLQGSVDAYIGMDSQGRVFAWNRSAELIFGWSREEAIGRLFTELVVPESRREWALTSQRRYAQTGKGETVGIVTEQVAVRRDGSEFPIELIVNAVRLTDEITFHAFARDITERKTLEQRLGAYAAIVRANTDAIGAAGLDGKIVVFNPAAEQLLGYTAKEMIGRGLDEVAAMLSPTNSPELTMAGFEAAAGGQTITDIQQRRRKDGRVLSVRVIIQPLRDVAGVIVGVCMRSRDITEETATTIALEINEALTQAIVDGTSSPITVRDADFKYLLVNKAAAQALAVTTEQMIDRPDSETLSASEIVRLRVGNHRVLAGETVWDEVTVAVEGSERTFSRQRFPVAAGERAPRAIASIATDITERKRTETALSERLQWEEHITTAVREGTLLVYSQPIVDLATGAQVGEELLIRMRGGHNPGDVVLPEEFLPQAERFGLMHVIDSFMVGHAIDLAVAGRTISVNLSAHSLQDQTLANEVLARLALTPHAASRLTFEITETAAMNTLANAREFSARLAELGAGMALDDFGTGYGTFTELRNLALKCLKIDRSFVCSLAHSPADQHIVRTIVAIAAEFGLTTIAEGVEDNASLQLLREMGVDQAQGFLIAAPAPVAT